MTRPRSILLAAAFMAVLSVGALSQSRSSQSRSIAIRAGRLFDGKSSTMTTNQVVLIEGERIKAVGADVKIPADATVLDFSRVTVLPGMIDTHVHLYDQLDG